MRTGVDHWAINPVVGFACVILLWMGIFWLLGRISGWARLAETYRAQLPTSGQHWSLQTAYMRFWSHYGSCLTFAADPHGLGISIFLLFRVGHPPLFIPWNEISVRPVRFLFIPYMELTFRNAPIPLRITRRLAQRITPFLAVGAALPGGSGAAYGQAMR